jgi:hypothetical protein
MEGEKVVDGCFQTAAVVNTDEDPEEKTGILL